MEEPKQQDGGYTIFSVATALSSVLRVVGDRYPIQGPFLASAPAAVQLTVQAEGVEGDEFLRSTRANVDATQRAEAARLHIIGPFCAMSLYQGDFLHRICNSPSLTG